MTMEVKLYFVCLALSLPYLAASTSVDVNATEVIFHDIDVVKRSSAPPNIPCTDSNEGLSKLDSSLHNYIWICRSDEWIPYQIEPSLGRITSLSADSCKHIREVLATNCNDLPDSGVYWVQDMQTYCDMTTDGGGWTLVWQHSYREISPLSTNMYYFSDYYKMCNTYASGWCNIPNKKRFNPTEQMIVAYHRGTIVYAYKGVFNYNIDHDWTGGVLVDFKKIIDRCAANNGIQPAPSTPHADRRLLGLAFDKTSPYVYNRNCDTVAGYFNSPTECRWYDCRLPPSISASTTGVQNTVAIYVR